MGVLCQDATHVILDAHLEEFRDLFNYDLLVEFVLGSVEFELSLLFLCDEHIPPDVSQAPPYALLKLMVLVMSVVFVVLRAVSVLVLLNNVALLRLALLEELKEFQHGCFNESVQHISVFNLRRYVSLNGIPEALDTLFAHRTDIWKIFLCQLAHVYLDDFTQRLACIVYRSVCRTTLDVGLTALLAFLPLAVVQFEIV